MAYNNGSSLSVVGKVFKFGVSSRNIIRFVVVMVFRIYWAVVTLTNNAVRLFMIEANFNKPLLVAYTYSLATPGSLLHSLQLHTNKAPRYVILDPLASSCEDEGM